MLLHRCLYGDAPSYLADLITPSAAATIRPGLRSAAPSSVVVPRTISSLGDRSFATAGPRALNKLPPPIRRVYAPATFKRQLKTFLYNHANSHCQAPLLCLGTYVALIRLFRQIDKYIGRRLAGESLPFLFFLLRSSAFNGGPTHMARTSGSVHMERSTVGHAPGLSIKDRHRNVGCTYFQTKSLKIP